MNHVEAQCLAPSFVKVSHFNLHRNVGTPNLGIGE